LAIGRRSASAQR